MSPSPNAGQTAKRRRPPLLREAVQSKFVIVSWGLTLAALAAAYWPALGFWWSRWFESESYYSHGPFVPLASVFVIWFNRNSLAALPVKPSKLGYAIVLPAALAGWIAWMGASASVMGFTLPLFLFGAIVATLGWQLACGLAFPVFFLYFTAVLPEAVLTAVSFKVQMLSISLATAGLRAVHVSATHTGAYITMSDLTVEVGSACSGFRLVVSMLAVAAFFAYIRQGPKWGKAALVAGALPLSIIANSLRIMLVSLVGREWGTSALRTAHDMTGYVLLVLTVGLLLIFARIVGCAKYKQMPSA